MTNATNTARRAKATVVHMPRNPNKVTADTKSKFGRAVWHTMVARGLYEAELGRLAGIPRYSINDYVHGRVYPSPLSMSKLTTALGTTEEDLLDMPKAKLESRPAVASTAESGTGVYAPAPAPEAKPVPQALPQQPVSTAPVLTVGGDNPLLAHLQIDRFVSLDTAVKIMTLLAESV